MFKLAAFSVIRYLWPKKSADKEPLISKKLFSAVRTLPLTVKLPLAPDLIKSPIVQILSPTDGSIVASLKVKKSG